MQILGRLGGQEASSRKLKKSVFCHVPPAPFLQDPFQVGADCALFPPFEWVEGSEGEGGSEAHLGSPLDVFETGNRTISTFTLLTTLLFEGLTGGRGQNGLGGGWKRDTW